MSELGKASYNGASVPWDVIPLLQYIDNPKKYNKETGFECDDDWARSRAAQILADIEKFSQPNKP